MENKKYIKNLEEFIIELKLNSKTAAVLKDEKNKWDNEMEEFESIGKKYKVNESKKKY